MTQQPPANTSPRMHTLIKINNPTPRHIPISLPLHNLNQSIRGVPRRPSPKLNTHFPPFSPRQVSHTKPRVKSADLPPQLRVIKLVTSSHHIQSRLAHTIRIATDLLETILRIKPQGQRPLLGRNTDNIRRLGGFLEQRFKHLGKQHGAKDVGLEGLAQVGEGVAGAGDDDSRVVDEDVELAVGGFDVLRCGADGLFVGDVDLDD